MSKKIVLATILSINVTTIFGLPQIIQKALQTISHHWIRQATPVINLENDHVEIHHQPDIFREAWKEPIAPFSVAETPVILTHRPEHYNHHRDARSDLEAQIDEILLQDEQMRIQSINL